MKAKIFYFSGTGNSLIAGKKIAEGIEGTLEPIVKYQKENLVKVDEDIIGIVFPVYLAQISGIPEIVREFFSKLEFHAHKYYFVVCTYGGYAWPNAFPAIKRCVEISKSYKGKIDGRFYVRFPMNNLDYDHIPIPIERDTSIILAEAEKKIESIIRMIKNRKKGNIFSQYIINFTFGRFLSLAKTPIMKSMRKYAYEPEYSNLTYHQLVPLSDKSITFYEDKCTGCGICERVCPVNNIKIENEKPIWLHTCQMCFACDEWCPQKAIHHWGKIIGLDYHHPSVKAKDMMKQKNYIFENSL
jgi:NAD-dependent dihydropyrimidine dehydrogenase PreA subunit/flavodoxin